MKSVMPGKLGAESIEINSWNSELKTVYDESFFSDIAESSARSAHLVVPVVLSLVRARSVVDVGCGVGTWAAEFLKVGVPDVLGIDGNYVNRRMLRIPEKNFLPQDLAQPIRVDRQFDLAVCLEVAEHLPASRARGLIFDLTRLAPVVLFSAAVPGQGGTEHVNEQFLSYWCELFQERGYQLVDVLRPAIWNYAECAGPYRQNAVFFAARNHPLASLPAATGIDYIHPFLYNQARENVEQPTLGFLLKSLPRTVRRSVVYRMRRIWPGKPAQTRI